MKSKSLLGFGCVLMLTTGALRSQAAGFALYETSARGVAMGGALAGGSGDASTLYNNPAAMTEVPGGNILAGVSLIQPSLDVTLTGPYLGSPSYAPDDKWFPPPHAYVSQQLDDSWWLGLGLYAPFGLGVEHDRDWPGRYNSVETRIVTFDFNPNVAYKNSDSLSAAAGLQLVWFDLRLTRMLPTGERLLEIEADSLGAGASASLAWEVLDDLSLGLIYRSEVKQSVEGDADVSGLQSVDVEGDVTLPASYSLGLNYTGIKRWNLGAVATYTGWSSYDELAMNFDPPLLGKVPRSVARKDWDDVWRLGAGAEYQLDDKTALQAGYVYDCDPIPSETADYLLPAGSRNIFSLGVSRKVLGNWHVDAAYAYLLIKSAGVEPRLEEGVLPSKFENGDTHIVSLSVGRPF
ncbi:MAG: outer membrane protein transport protein [Kiritimatiellae bacterium]|nr:outer membrane protein transport protein [Kiritimatiellia bacterium]